MIETLGMLLFLFIFYMASLKLINRYDNYRNAKFNKKFDLIIQKHDLIESEQMSKDEE